MTSNATPSEAHHRQAIATLGASGLTVELARARLLYGEWLRRCRRRNDAKEQLRESVRLFEDAQAPAFIQRARRELAALGEHSPGAATGRAAMRLTAQEATVARLAAAGGTNAEIGATLFLSVNTVDYHLRKVFHKLAITSRRQLAERLEDPPT
ncbi:hypothetical protein GTQ99_22845 [Kineococcus sp. T13]|uniref:helix-turn-helix transcriptional regulator n=1 Tax=Kineococcus vitellinus TaxID=2696565 RepID=UPI0014127F34|nr:helix-turn-helix transcriptional regulator [Kineococcus vitellinus]NAZ78223.1 hypothetical protein [Kineococcus vitellinus]